jgi:repressor LexA
MDLTDPRAALDALVTRSGVGYAALSRMIRRNPAYLQQYVKRGSPRTLGEQDRKMLAAFFRVEETVLGGPVGTAVLPVVRRLDLAASAGPGTLADEERAAGSLVVDPRLLTSLGLDAATATFLPATGDSMEPTICDGDLMLVDEGERQVGTRGGIYVLRHDGVLMVKRLSRDKAGLVITSDNPAYPPVVVKAVEIVGRVVWLSRALR